MDIFVLETGKLAKEKENAIPLACKLHLAFSKHLSHAGLPYYPPVDFPFLPLGGGNDL